jgi:hypothetical protein
MFRLSRTSQKSGTSQLLMSPSLGRGRVHLFQNIRQFEGFAGQQFDLPLDMRLQTTPQARELAIVLG